TAANMPWQDIEYVLPSVDLVLLDLKVMDDRTHKYATGASNKRILENARRLAGHGVDIIVRIPVIPGINATHSNMQAAADFLESFPRLLGVDLLPYHDLGVDKLASLGYADQGSEFDTPSDELLSSLSQPFIKRRIPVKTGAG
ncbi:MAG: glycyl-radical enzyme activating protein, partial [Anaerolineales bacterium]